MASALFPVVWIRGEVWWRFDAGLVKVMWVLYMAFVIYVLNIAFLFILFVSP
jgi:hypothetical protein